MVLMWCSFMVTSTVTQLFVAKAFLHWYWQPGKKGLTPKENYKSTLWSVLRYHWGTAVKGSFLIPLTTLPMSMQVKIDRARRKYPRNRKIAILYFLFYPLHLLCKW